ncbi:hypothetical protein GCM10028857_16330 [Salinarchaeum chitinilyticum]
MIVADTSALITLATADVLSTVLSEFDVHTTSAVESELRRTAEYDDDHARGADRCLRNLDRIEMHDVETEGFESARIDSGEGSCVHLAREANADFLLTDDLRALPELNALTDAQVAISPIVLRALRERGVLNAAEARDRLEVIADTRDWLGAPIYRRARSLLPPADSE